MAISDIARVFTEVDRRRVEADNHFVGGLWAAAIENYEIIASLLDEIWKVTVEPSKELLARAHGSAQRHAFALAQLGRADEAVLALETGLARYLMRLTKVHEITEVSDEGVIGYLKAVEDLLHAQARQVHPNLHDGMGGINALAQILTNMGQEDAAAYNRLQSDFQRLLATKDGHDQFMYVYSATMRGLRPTIPLNIVILRQIHDHFVAIKNIFDKYNSFVQSYDILTERTNQSRTLVGKYAEGLPVKWLAPTLSDIDDAIGLTGPAETSINRMPIVYFVATEIGSMCVFIYPDNPRNIEFVFDRALKEADVDQIRNSFADINALLRPILRRRIELERSLVQLWRIVAPVVHALRSRGWSVAALVPTGEFMNLPLHAARPSTDNNVESFGERIAITYTASARMLSKARRTAARFQDTPYYIQAVVNPLPTTRVSLPAAKCEVDIVSARFAKKWGDIWLLPRVWDGEGATRQFAMHAVGGR